MIVDYITYKSHFFWCENVKILPSFMQLYNRCHYITLLNCKPLVVYVFYCMALYHSQMRCHVINSSFALCLKIFKLKRASNRDFGKEISEGSDRPKHLSSFISLPGLKLRECTKKLLFTFLNQNMLWVLKRTVSMRRFF